MKAEQAEADLLAGLKGIYLALGIFLSYILDDKLLLDAGAKVKR
jgi:hypothetical protein